MIVSTSCAHVSKNVAIGGGTVCAILAIRSSEIGPGPLGIADTSPIADAPYRIARFASAMLAMQQILIFRLLVGPIRKELFTAETQRAQRK